MCQSQQVVTLDPSFCHPGSNFRGKKLKTRRSSIFSQELELGTYIEDITRWREDMNFIFEWQNNILRTSAASE